MALIFVNPGHWPFQGAGYDPGAVNKKLTDPAGNMLTEAYIVRLIANRLKTRLQQMGHNVVVFGAPTLRGIVQKANEVHADVFVSLHCNALNGTVRGVEVFSNRFDAEGAKLSHSIYNEIKWSQRQLKRAPLYWRGDKRAGFYVIKYTKMPAALVEMGFIDNPQEGEEMLTLTWQNRMTEAIAQGIKLYLEKKGR